jgi:3-oxoadipyl-CoA thiolase
VGTAARAIAAGEMDFAIAGGVESMSRAPFVMGKAEMPFQRQTEIFDTTMGWRFVNPQMRTRYGIETMPETGENVARDFNISREAQDVFAYRSQMRTSKAQKDEFFAEEIIPVEVKGSKSSSLITCDEHPRPDTTQEALAKLKPLHVSGTVTAGNASGINDGAAALIVASESAVRRHGLKPCARILGMTVSGVGPRIMGMGPVPATQKLLARLNLELADFDWIELNEAFASQAIACLRQLGIAEDAEHVNATGGAIALGHPLGMSGARLALTAAHKLDKFGGRRALATMCIGVGQGIALAIEHV